MISPSFIAGINIQQTVVHYVLRSCGSYNIFPILWPRNTRFEQRLDQEVPDYVYFPIRKYYMLRHWHAISPDFYGHHSSGDDAVHLKI
jgi:hypothetical protein